MKLLAILAILFVILKFGFLLKLAFTLILVAALGIGLMVLWRLKWVILGILGLEELFLD